MSKQDIGYLNSKQRQKAITALISFFLDERGEEIGIIAAEDLLDFFLEDIADSVYKKGVTDAKKLFAEKMEMLDFELELLEKKEKK